MFSYKKTRVILSGFFLFLAALYFLCRNAYYVGFFNDDAFYLIGARSLVQGGYRELSRPGMPFLLNYFPGYSLLLWPWSAFSPNYFLPHQIFSMGLTLGSIALLAVFLKKFSLTRLEMGAILLIAAVNPLTVSMSGTILSDVPFLFFPLLVFVLVQRHWNSDRLVNWATISTASFFCVCLRPDGLAVPLSLLLALYWEHRWKPLKIVTAFAALYLGASFLTPLFEQGVRYWQEAHSFYGADTPLYSRGSILLSNAKYYLVETFYRNLLRWPVVSVDHWIVLLSSMGAFAVGMMGLKKIKFVAWQKFVGLYLLIYAGVHLLWGNQGGRYIFPVFPFIVFLFFNGMGALGDFYGQRKAAIAGTTILILLLYLIPLKNILSASISSDTPANTPARHAYQWVQDNTEPNDIFATDFDGRFYLWTARQSYLLPEFSSADLLAAWCQERNIHYLFFEPLEGKMGRKRIDLSPLFLEKQFVLVFEDSQEKTRIYKIQDPLAPPFPM